jgi:hypothetical protein
LTSPDRKDLDCSTEHHRAREPDYMVAEASQLEGARYLTHQEAASYCRLSKSKLSDLNARGEGPRRIKIDGRILYRVADLDRWIDEHEENGSAAESVEKAPAKSQTTKTAKKTAAVKRLPRSTTTAASRRTTTTKLRRR